MEESRRMRAHEGVARLDPADGTFGKDLVIPETSGPFALKDTTGSVTDGASPEQSPRPN